MPPLRKYELTLCNNYSIIVCLYQLMIYLLVDTYDLFIGMIDMYLNGLNELDIIYFFEYPHSTGNCQNKI